MKFNNIQSCIWINNKFYVLKNNNSIEIYNDTLDNNQQIITKEEFKIITYNEKEKIFYLIDKDNSLYKSEDLNFFERVESNINYGEVKHISYCKYYNSFVVTTNNKIFMTDLKKGRIKPIYEAKKVIEKVNDCVGPLCSANNQSIELLSSIYCSKDIYVAYRKDHVCFISKLANEKSDDIVYKTNQIIKTLFVIDNEIWTLIDNGKEQLLVSTGIDYICDEENCEKSKNKIIESIALMEISLSKILNSEALKIKSTMEKSENINDLICINSSLKEMIYYITLLEFVWVEKLKTINPNSDYNCI